MVLSGREHSLICVRGEIAEKIRHHHHIIPVSTIVLREFLAKNGTPFGSDKYHTIYKETCKTWILHVSFWIIVPSSLTTVEIASDKYWKNL